MKSKIKGIALSAVLLLLGYSIWLNISLIRSGRALNRLLTENGTVILSPDLTEMLLSDLKSADKTRMEQWWTYLDQSSRHVTNLNALNTSNVPVTNHTTQ
jgi:hypothetical protein